MPNTDKAPLLFVVQATDPTGSQLVQRVPPDGPGEITLGSQLIVRESQVALFFRDGKALDVLGPGRHTLNTANIPILINLLKIPFGAQTPFPAEVYFVNLKDYIDQTWSSANALPFRDPDFGMIRLATVGKFAFNVSQPQQFVNQVVGTQGLYGTADIISYLASILVSRLTDILGKAQVGLLDLPAHYSEFSAALRVTAANDLSALGLALKAVYITALSVPPEIEKAIDERASMGAIGNMDAYLKFRAARALGDAAASGGNSVVNAGVSVGAGLALGGVMAGLLRDSMQPTATVRLTTPDDAFAALVLVINRQATLNDDDKRRAIQGVNALKLLLNQSSSTLESIGSARQQLLVQFPWLGEPLATLFAVPSIQQELGSIAVKSL